MRASILIAVSLLAVALAGCSDDPPSGEVTGASVDVPVAGDVTLSETRFSEPQPNTGTPGQTCQTRESSPQPGQKCTYPSTQLSVHLMALPDPQAQSYSAMLFSEASGASEDLGMLEANGTADNMMYNLAMDNTSQCVGEYSDEGCVKSDSYDQVRVYLGELLVAIAPLQDGASFVANPAFSGHSFALSFTGKDATVEFSGAGNLTYELVLYTADETGAVSAAENYPISIGSNEVTAEMEFDQYAEAHVHVLGTKVNLAKGTFA